MSQEFDLGEHLQPLVERLVDSYRADERTHHIGRLPPPSQQAVMQSTRMLIELLYPGYFGRQDLTWHNVAYHVGELLPRITTLLGPQIRDALCHQQEIDRGQADTQPCKDRACTITCDFLKRIPALREKLAGDVQAAYDGDPAAASVDEVILAYPGVLAVTVYRIAHELFTLGVPMIPRIMAEWAHSVTGVDIHPGARIGRNFFIDHATGVVIGETTEIGDNVKLYQGVTLGAVSIPRDERGRAIRSAKRHPTVRDGVTVYANAIILGGETVIGEHSVVGGTVFITGSVPDNHTVNVEAPKLHVQDRTAAQRTSGTTSD